MHSIGLIETSSIAKGIEVGDAMAKTANVSILTAKTICPGKYIVMVGGEVAAVNASVAQGEVTAGSTLVDRFVIANIHSSILPAMIQSRSRWWIRSRRWASSKPSRWPP